MGGAMSTARYFAFVFAVVAAASDTAAGETAPGQHYPLKTVRITAGSAGNAVDWSARYLGKHLSEQWGKQVIVENRAGQALISAEIVAKAQPDGYTLCMGEFSTHVAAPSLLRQLAYDPITDFTPITLVMKAPLMLVANPKVPAADLQELVSYAKSRPGDLKYAAQSIRSAGNLSMQMLIRSAGIDMLHVPYKRAADSLNSIVGGETEVSFLAPPVALPYLHTGKLRVLAISSAKRSASAPEIPTVAESGLPGFEVVMWSGIFAPPRMPRPLLEKLNRDMTGILNAPAAKTQMAAQGVEAAPGTPEELGAYVRSEIPRWRQLIKDAGIVPE